MYNYLEFAEKKEKEIYIVNKITKMLQYENLTRPEIENILRLLNERVNAGYF